MKAERVGDGGQGPDPDTSQWVREKPPHTGANWSQAECGNSSSQAPTPTRIPVDSSCLGGVRSATVLAGVGGGGLSVTYYPPLQYSLWGPEERPSNPKEQGSRKCACPMHGGMLAGGWPDGPQQRAGEAQVASS